MSKKPIKPNGKHLLEEDRAFIAESLQMNMTLKEIAAKLSKDPTTIAKEIKTNRTFKAASNVLEKVINLCVYRKTCEESYVCAPEDRSRHCAYGCRHCNFCNELCKKFKRKNAPPWQKPLTFVIPAAKNASADWKSITTKR